MTTDIQILQDLCRRALHMLETPGDFSEQELFQLMFDLNDAGYDPDMDEESV